MGLLSSFFGSFDKSKYDSDNEKICNAFLKKYPLDSASLISSIPLSAGAKYQKAPKMNAVTVPEAILSRKATEFQKENRYDLAIACLKKANELRTVSIFAYGRKDYQRLPEMMKNAGLFAEARAEEERLDSLYGTEIDMLKHLMRTEAKGKEEKERYKKEVLIPAIEQERDRKEYDLLREFAPELAPKSFSGYRRMKNGKSDNYLKLKEKASVVGIVISDAEIKL